jgi:hypothetical protein
MTSCLLKCSINPTSNPNPVFSHSNTWHYQGALLRFHWKETHWRLGCAIFRMHDSSGDVYSHVLPIGYNSFTHSLTHSLTHSWSWALLEKLPIVQLLKNFPAFYGTRRFITVFTRVLHWSLSWSRSIQSIPSHPTSLKSILILSTYLRLGLPSGLFPSYFLTNILYAFSFSPIRATWHALLILLDFIILIIHVIITLTYLKINIMFQLQATVRAQLKESTSI